MKTCILALWFLISSSAAASINGGNARLKMQNPNLFQGDILGFDLEDRNVIPNAEKRWPNATVPYEIAEGPSGMKDAILFAMGEIHDKTCVRFVPRTNETNYIKIVNDDGFYSHVGMVGGEQILSLDFGFVRCQCKGSILHELGHVLGFYHEHVRSDRDEHLTIHWENIEEGMESMFAVMKPDQNLLLTPFDYDSIMIFGNYAYSKDGQSKTMEAKNGRPLTEPIDKEGLSSSDVIRINKMYC